MVENQIPNLTIFVPELPDNSFSAELWDVETDIPDVGVRTFDTEGVPAFNGQKVNILLVPQKCHDIQLW